MSTELRCPSKLHGVVQLENGLWIFEVRCRSTFCGYRPGAVVLHRFGLNGELHDTLKFKDPTRRKVSNAPQHDPASVRSS